MQVAAGRDPVNAQSLDLPYRCRLRNRQVHRTAPKPDNSKKRGCRARGAGRRPPIDRFTRAAGRVPAEGRPDTLAAAGGRPGERAGAFHAGGGDRHRGHSRPGPRQPARDTGSDRARRARHARQPDPAGPEHHRVAGHRAAGVRPAADLQRRVPQRASGDQGERGADHRAGDRRDRGDDHRRGLGQPGLSCPASAGRPRWRSPRRSRPPTPSRPRRCCPGWARRTGW